MENYPILRAVLLSIAASGAILGIFLATASPGAVHFATKPPETGSVAPEIHAVNWINIAGPQSLAALKDKFVVIEFWATWCPPCVASIPHLNELHEKYGDRVVLLSLTDEPLEKIQPFATEHKMNYPLGTGSKSIDTYAVEGIPHSIVIAPGGKIVWQGMPTKDLNDALDKVLPPVK